MIVAPPRLVGTATVARFFGVSRHRLYLMMSHPCGDEPWMHGYLGKIARQHTWNFPQLVAATFDSDASMELVLTRLTDPADPLDLLLCAAPGCEYTAEQVGLCDIHLRRLFTAWRQAHRSSVVTLQLVAMCRWIVDRNAHLVLPAGFDPWSNICMTPGCGKSTNIRGEHAWHGPLCLDCSAEFWDNPRVRPHPSYWKRGRIA